MGYFSMTKYTTDFKIDAVQRYFTDNVSLNTLAAELQLSSSMLKSWVNTAQQQVLMP